MSTLGQEIASSNGSSSSSNNITDVTESDGTDDFFAPLLRATRQDSDIIRETLRIYGSLYLACVLLFCYLRRRYPKLYNVRSWSPILRCPLAERMVYDGNKAFSYISWLWQVFGVSDADLQEHCGMDAVCFLRALRFGRRLAIVGCINATWLIPMYRTAEESLSTRYLRDPFALISVANVPSHSTRFVGTVIAAYIFYFYAMYLILTEYTWFTACKHTFLSRTVPRNYAVYVSGIPRAYRSSRQLAAYFRASSGHKDTVLEAHIVIETPRLDKLVARRAALIQRLEHVVALERRSSGREGEAAAPAVPAPQHSERATMRRMASVQEFQAELERLNRQIAQGIAEINASTDPVPLRKQLTRNNASKDLLRAIQQDVLDDQHENDHSPRNHDDRMQDSMSTMQEQQQQEQKATSSNNTLRLGNDSERSDDGASLSSGGLETCSNGMGDKEARSSASCIDRNDNDALLGDVEDAIQEVDDSESDLPLEASDHAGHETIEDTSKARPTMQRDESALGNDDGNHNSTHSIGSTSNSTSFHAVVLKSMASGTNVGLSILTNAPKVAGSTLVTTSKMATSAVVRTSKLAGTAVVQGSRVASAQAERLVTSAGETSAEALKRAQWAGTHVLSSAGAVVPLLLPKSQGQVTDAGFVVFTTLYAAQTALQMVHHPRPYVMTVMPAANPHDIFWRNVGLPHQARRSGLIAALAATSVLCFFYSIPMAFITSLTELNSIKESLPRLAAWIELDPTREQLLAQVAPLLLLLFNETILPSTLKYFATWEGHISSAMLEASLFVKLGCFMIIQTFFVSAITGGVTAELANILDDPGSVIPFLANSLPAQSSYFIQITLAQTFFLQSIEILRIYPLGLALLRRFFGPRLTAQERRRRWGMLHSVEDPPDFWHAETFAQLILLYMVLFVYNSIAPVTSCFLLFCFVLLESGYRYQFIHNYPRAFDTGGRLWKYFIHFTLASMVVALLTLIGLLSLKQSPYAGPALGPLLAVVCLFIMFLNARHSTVSEHLPTRDCILIDSKNASQGPMDMSFVKGAYLQPSLQNASVEPNYEGEDDAGDKSVSPNPALSERVGT